jgi:CheY-like chemotaxis protein
MPNTAIAWPCRSGGFICNKVACDNGISPAPKIPCNVRMKRVGTSDFDKPRVLLVDDEAAFAAMLRYNLETRGFLVEHVANGQEALSRSAKFQPHVVLVDWTLPGMCGIEVCRRLRSRPETKDVGVIMVTGRAGDQNAVRALDAGADDYVSSRSASLSCLPACGPSFGEYGLIPRGDAYSCAK